MSIIKYRLPNCNIMTEHNPCAYTHVYAVCGRPFIARSIVLNCITNKNIFGKYEWLMIDRDVAEKKNENTLNSLPSDHAQ